VRSAFEKYKNIGVRIEDDMLVTPTGVEWMTKDLPRKLEDVEAFMARASKEMAYVPRFVSDDVTLAMIGPAPAMAMGGSSARRGFVRFGQMPEGH
jgi:hypothetical protein